MGDAMGPETSLFTMALGLEAPWHVKNVQFDRALKQIDFEVAFKPGSRFTCPSCGAADQPVFDTRQRSWEYPSRSSGFLGPLAISFDEGICHFDELAHDGDDGDLGGLSCGA